MRHLNTAYLMGALTAHTTFIKEARGEVVTPIAGAFSPLLAGVTGGVTAPEGYGSAAGLGAGAGSLLGGLGGGVGGAALGGLSGYGLSQLLNKDPEVWTGGGATLGALLGAMGGGAAGAHIGRKKGIESETARRAELKRLLQETIATKG